MPVNHLTVQFRDSILQISLRILLCSLEQASQETMFTCMRLRALRPMRRREATCPSFGLSLRILLRPHFGQSIDGCLRCKQLISRNVQMPLFSDRVAGRHALGGRRQDAAASRAFAATSGSPFSSANLSVWSTGCTFHIRF